MPRKNSTTRSTGDDITATRLNDFNEDIDDLYSKGSDHLRVYEAISGTPLRIDITAGAYYIGSTVGMYAGGTDIVVTDAATNYVMIDNTGTITISTSARTAGLGRLAQVVCSGGAVTSIILRNNMVFGGAALDFTALTEDTSPDEENDFLFGYDTSAGLNKKVKPKNLNIRPFLEYTAGENLVAGNPVRYGVGVFVAQTITQASQNGNIQDIGSVVGDYGAGQSIVITGGVLNSISVDLRKQGTPTALVRISIYDSTGTTLILTSNNSINESTLTASFATYNFTFSDNFLPSGTYRMLCRADRAANASNHSEISLHSSNLYGTRYTVSSTYVRTATWGARKFSATINALNEPTTQVFRTKAISSHFTNFIGFARETVTAGNTAKIDTIVSRTQSGLTAFSDYYLGNTAGTISTSAGTVSKKIGKALSATEIAINYNPA